MIPPHNTFIVRFWWDEALVDSLKEGVARRWHGRVEHIQCGQSVSFRDAQTLLDFIQSCIGIPFSQSNEGSEK